MAEHLTDKTSSWHLFVDQVAAPLRLESPGRMKFGLTALLTIVREVWGEIIFLHAAERLITEHAFTFEQLSEPPPEIHYRLWFATWLTAHAPGVPAGGAHLSEIVKPAWSHAQS